MRMIASLLFAYLFLISTARSQEMDTQSLEKRYHEWVKAWNESDAETVADISWGNYGFGRDVPILRTGTNDQEAYEAGIRRYMESMQVLRYEVHYTNFRIVDGVGLVDGYYAQTTQQKNSPLRTVYGRQSLVFTMRDGNWKMIHYHRSLLPNEFTR